MGLFDFLKGGAKKAENESNTAAELHRSIEAMNLGIRDLHVAFSDGVATLRGIAPTQKDLELARLVVGNHQSVEKVNDDGLSLAPAPVTATPRGPQHMPGKMYTVKPGDTLSKIAQDELGDPGRYSEIYEANRPMLTDPNKIYPGQVLRVPKAA